MLRIITDSASDITIEEANEKDIILISLNVMFDEKQCPCLSEEDYNHFYKLLEKCDKLPTTSQPAPADFLEQYESAKEADDEVLVLTISSGLSGTYQSALIAADMAEYDKITVIDTHSVSTGQRILVEKAVQMRDLGISRLDIADFINDKKDKLMFFGIVDNLEYLKKGGRIPPALATIGTVLNLKPVLYVNNGVIETIAKARGFKQAISKLKGFFDENEFDPEWPVYFAYVHTDNRVIDFRDSICEEYNIIKNPLFPVGPVVGTHTGPGCIVMTYMMK